MLGSSDAAKRGAWAAETKDGKIGSFAEVAQLAELAIPAVRFVKAFNSVGFAHFIDPSFVGGRPTMFICGNDDLAKSSGSASSQQPCQ